MTQPEQQLPELQFLWFPLAPPAEPAKKAFATHRANLGRQGFEVLGSENWVKNKSDKHVSVFICSPYLNAPALEWLTAMLPEREGHSLYILTCARNRPRRKHPFIRRCVREFVDRTKGIVYICVYPGGGKSREDNPLIHSKLYLCSSGPDLRGKLNKFPAGQALYTAWFGSANFTDRGLGLNGRKQSFELLARASNASKKRLAEQFRWYWCRGGIERWNSVNGELAKH